MSFAPEINKTDYIRLFLDLILEGDTSFIDFINEIINETIKYCKGEIDIYNIKRDCFNIVTEWSNIDKKFFCELNLNNINTKVYVRIRNFYEPKIVNRITKIDEILNDE